MGPLAAIISLVASATSVLASVPVVKLQAGEVHGITCSSSSASLYQGIPYAQPPTGKLRFLPPQPLAGSYSGGVLDATKPPAACIQIPGAFAWSEPTESEDCLYLNVYVPQNVSSSSSLPVKVWGYGGSDLDGAVTDPLYDLCNLGTDVIGVSFNYRVGPWGFLGLNSAGVKGNMAIKDWVAVLEWVHENIGAFGGDPDKVMLFGQSSGGDDAFITSTLPQAKSFIRGAVFESGGGINLPSYETVQHVGESYAATLNCSSSDLSCLQSRSVKQLLEAYMTTPALLDGVGIISNPALLSWQIGLPNSPSLSASFVDGEFITKQPLLAGPQVPAIWGSNLHDGSLFSLPPLFESGGPITEHNYTVFLSQFDSATAMVEKKYPLSAFNSSGSTEQAVTEAITYILTTQAYTCSQYRGLRSAAYSGVPAYAYIFNHTLSCPWLWTDGELFPNKQERPLFGPTHTEELPLVFGNLNKLPFGNGSCSLSPSDVQLSTTLRNIWTAMAENGSPDIQELTWPTFDACSTKGILISDTATPATLDFSACEFWDQVLASVQGVDVKWPDNATCSSNGSQPTSTPPSTGNGNSNTPQAIPIAFAFAIVLGIMCA